eukprot:COSAG04_NODE_4_length_52282_cov_12.667133_22_plen_97_part_00
MLSLLILGALHLLLRRRTLGAAILYGLAVHFKLYPTAFSAVALGGCPAVDKAGQLGSTDLSTANSFTWSPELGFLRSAYASCNLCIGMCGHNATAG